MDPWFQRTSGIVAGFALVGALFRACGFDTWDWQTLLYIVAAGIILLLPYATKIKLSKDGVELELPPSVRELGIGGKKPPEVRSSSNEGAEGAQRILTSDDPQKGRWGGQEVRNDRRLSAVVRAIPGTPDWFSVKLTVSSTRLEKPLSGEVVFHIHPTFKKDKVTVEARGGKAELELVAWGAFTVGAECDEGKTQLELDLARLPDAPHTFTLR